MRNALLVFVLYNLVTFLLPSLLKTSALPIDVAISNSLAWFVWYVVLGLLARFGGKNHPPFEPGPLSPVRKGVALFSLVLFLLLFMPTPFSIRME
jgi:hypothetical protein